MPEKGQATCIDVLMIAVDMSVVAMHIDKPVDMAWCHPLGCVVSRYRRQGRANERATVKEVQFLSGGNGVMVRKVIAILTQHIPVEDIKSIGYDFGR